MAALPFAIFLCLTSKWQSKATIYLIENNNPYEHLKVNDTEQGHQCRNFYYCCCYINKDVERNKDKRNYEKTFLFYLYFALHVLLKVTPFGLSSENIPLLTALNFNTRSIHSFKYSVSVLSPPLPTGDLFIAN